MIQFRPPICASRASRSGGPHWEARLHKIIRLTLLAFLVSVAVSACGGSDQNSSTADITQTTEPASESGESNYTPLEALVAHLEGKGLAVVSDQPGDAKAAIKVGPVKVAEYRTAQEAKKAEGEIREVFSEEEISGEGRVALVGNVLIYVADEHALPRSKVAALETVVAALDAGK